MNIVFDTISMSGFLKKFSMSFIKIFNIVTVVCSIVGSNIDATYVTFDFSSNDKCQISAYYDEDLKIMKTETVNDITEFPEKLSIVTNGKLTVNSVYITDDSNITTIVFDGITNNNNDVTIFMRGINNFNPYVRFAFTDVVKFREIIGSNIQLSVGSDLKLNSVIESYYKINNVYQIKRCFLKNENLSDGIGILQSFSDFFRIGVLTNWNLSDYGTNHENEPILLRK